MKDNFRIRIRKGDTEIEVEGTENFVYEQFARMTDLLRISEDRDIVGEEKKISVVELLERKLPQKHTEEIAVFAYYVDKMLRKPYFSVSDIGELYSRSKMKGPANINDTINALVRKGIIMEVDEEKENVKCWTITRSGIDLVESEMGMERIK